MGFGFNLFFIIIFFPLVLILVILFGLTKKKIFVKMIGYGIAGGIVIMITSSILQWVNAKKVLKKTDYYGDYIIDRNFFKGKQADWQYENYRFTITEEDSVYFYVTNANQIVETYRGTIGTVNPYGSEILIINMESPKIHVLDTNPTIYRSKWDFYMVFNSPKFKNMYFKKGKWESFK